MNMAPETALRKGGQKQAPDTIDRRDTFFGDRDNYAWHFLLAALDYIGDLSSHFQ